MLKFIQLSVEKQKRLYFLLAFILGLGSPFICSFITAILYIPIYLGLYGILTLVKQVFFIKNSVVVLVMLKYTFLLFGLLLIPSINALLFGFDNRFKIYKFITLTCQMFIFYALVAPTHWYFPLCLGNDCILSTGDTATLTISGQNYLKFGLSLLAFAGIVSGSYIATCNPINLIWACVKKIKFENRHFKIYQSIGIPSKEPVLLNLFLVSGSWILLIILVMITGFIIM